MTGRYVPEVKCGDLGAFWVLRDEHDPYRTLVTDACTEKLLVFPDESAASEWAERQHGLDLRLPTRGQAAP